MTRENKLALVIGFGLLLFVGILISDHFSVARSQVAADLRPTDDPLNRVRATSPDLLNIGVSRPAAVPANVEGSGAATVRTASETLSPVPRSDMSRLDMPDLQPRVQLVDFSEGVITTTPSSETIHVIAKGESLTAICRTYFNDASLVKKLAAYNGMDDPNRLRQGDKIRIPHPQLLGISGASAPAAASGVNSPPRPNTQPNTQPNTKPAGKTYTVREGDMLSEIAQKTMGSSRKWYTLYKYNANIIDDPDRLDVGLVLRIPAQ